MAQTTVTGGYYNPVIGTGNRVVGGTGTPGLTQAAGQGFSLASAIYVEGINLSLRKVGLPTDTLTVGIYTSNTFLGTPRAVGTIAASSLTTTSTVYSIMFSSTTWLISSQSFYIGITRTPDVEDTSNYVKVDGAGNGTGFVYGSFYYKWNGVWTQDFGDDLYFGLLESANTTTSTSTSSSSSSTSSTTSSTVTTGPLEPISLSTGNIFSMQSF